MAKLTQRATGYSGKWIAIGEGPKTIALKALEPEEEKLLTLFRSSDDRGKASILRAAESQIEYVNKKIA